MLDASRWNLKRAARRSLERPLFYEGWACLAEVLMEETGAFSNRWDPFILAARRLRRAVRGRVDLCLQSGRMDLKGAEKALANAAFPRRDARSAARKYALRPGYQVCYTVGIRRFLALRRSAGKDLRSFVRGVLAEGELDFGELERALKREKTT